MIQTASHLSPNAVGNIQTASPEPGLESSLIFTPVSYLVHFLPKLSLSHVDNHDLRRQLAEERHERLELTDLVARMERRQESRRE
ncbi:hypothetical protein Tco_0997314 [Tanacetum coccineum]